MTPTTEHRAIGLLETALTELAELRGENRAAHKALDERTLRLEANHDLLLTSQQEHGARLASLPCERHARRISEALRLIHAEEVTGRIEIARGTERRELLRTLGRVGLALLVAVAGAFGGYLMR